MPIKQKLVGMVALVVGRSMEMGLLWHLVETERLQSTVGWEYKDTTALTQQHSLTSSVVVGVLVLGLLEQVALMEVREVLEGRMGAGAVVEEQLDTQLRLALVALVVLVEEAQLKSYFTDRLPAYGN
jgi:hypothetical protein